MTNYRLEILDGESLGRPAWRPIARLISHTEEQARQALVVQAKKFGIDRIRLVREGATA